VSSPIAHATIGYAIFEIAHRTRASAWGERRGRLRWQLVAALGLSLLPDVDSILGLLAGDMGRYHNNLTHSILVGLAVASIVGLVALLESRRQGLHWFAIALACYGCHLLADVLTIGRGIMWLWPWSSGRLLSPVSLFYGLHWSDGLWSVRHVWTLLTELGFAALLFLAVESLPRWRRGMASGSAPRLWPDQGR
jgi:membrane-bound metal-dependent hydrolase YbcI (DUF457 family)